jgi:hypothetical protein
MDGSNELVATTWRLVFHFVEGLESIFAVVGFTMRFGNEALNT